MITKEQIQEQDRLTLEAFLNNPSKSVNFIAGGWHHIDQLLSKAGYKRGELDTNGWNYDYWIVYTKSDSEPLMLIGCGHTGTSSISVHEEEFEDIEEQPKEEDNSSYLELMKRIENSLEKLNKSNEI